MATLKDKVVIVIGAGKGIGRLVAEALATHGAIVATNDITPVNLDETVRRIKAAGGRVRAYVEDIAKKMPVQALVKAVEDDWGRIDVLVNAAEVTPTASVLEMDDWDWQRTLDVNLSGAFLLTQSVGRVMKAKGGGVIIHIGGKPMDPGGHAAYTSSKAGLVAFVENARGELVASGIRVHLVLPAQTDDIATMIMALIEAGLSLQD